MILCAMILLSVGSKVSDGIDKGILLLFSLLSTSVMVRAGYLSLSRAPVYSFSLSSCSHSLFSIYICIVQYLQHSMFAPIYVSMHVHMCVCVCVRDSLSSYKSFPPLRSSILASPAAVCHMSHNLSLREINFRGVIARTTEPDFFSHFFTQYQIW